MAGHDEHLRTPRNQSAFFPPIEFANFTFVFVSIDISNVSGSAWALAHRL